MIKIRLDVDYAYPSRTKGFIYTALRRKTKRSYLKNPKTIAKMINESSVGVKAYWFFTPYTTPDAEFLEMLNPEKHEVALHVANEPYKELNVLEKATGRKVNFYTVHGTERLLGKIIWGRKLSQAKAPIPSGFPLKSFYDFSTTPLDRVCYDNSVESALKIAEESVVKGDVLLIHPEWLLQRGTFNHRGPYYEVLRRFLGVDKEIDNLGFKKKSFFKLCKYSEQFEYIHDISPDQHFVSKLADRGFDVFTFIERKWCRPLSNPSKQWIKTKDNIALLTIGTYAEWLQKVGKKTRNMVRKADKSGVKVEVVEPSDKLAEGIWKIYNETPVRQGRAFTHYGLILEEVKNVVYNTKNSVFLAAHLENELVGFIQLLFENNIVIILQILSLQKHWDKAVNNALLAKAVEVCASKNAKWLMYGRIGNHLSLDAFKQSNGFEKYQLTRYYVPLTRKGKIAVKLKLHQELKDAIPERIKKKLFSAYNWVSRTKTKLRK